ncbi:MAG: helix-turn-helix transcriptional regulator [Treponema sp.]|nr:helix-turn-helix transcriptional regulator [Treponema sp.]
MQSDTISSFSIPTIDVPATSQNLKKLRENNNITVAQIQNLLGMENPQSIYTWENPEKKYLPRLDNLITLAKIYRVTLDELIVIKKEENPTFELNESQPLYGIEKEILDFILANASNETKLALTKYYLMAL